MTAGVFRVLHVCTGNICRSPMAERLMRAGLTARLGDRAGLFLVESAGTLGHDGSRMEPFALATLADYGLAADDFRARELTPEHVAAADLVLTATREHRAAAVTMHPRAAGRTFTLLEFARLGALVEPSSLPADDVVWRAEGVVRAAATGRGSAPPGVPREDDVADPYLAPQGSFQACGQLLHDALTGSLDLLVGL